MFTGDLIDRVITYDDNVDASDADNASHRARILQYCQETFDFVWNYQPWTFKLRTVNPLTVAANAGAVDVPSDFGNLGPSGKVYLVSTGQPLREITYQELSIVKHLGVTSGDIPAEFAIGGYNTTTMRPRVNILNNPASVDLAMDYEAASPILADTKVSSTSFLEYIPSAYHFSVLLPGVRALSLKTMGSKEDWFGMFQKGLAYMCDREIPMKGQVNQMPRANVGMY